MSTLNPALSFILALTYASYNGHIQDGFKILCSSSNVVHVSRYLESVLGVYKAASHAAKPLFPRVSPVPKDSKHSAHATSKQNREIGSTPASDA